MPVNAVELMLLLIRSIDERSLVYFADSPRHVLEAYVESGEGLDRAGGFAIQVRLPSKCGTLLILM